jgi:N-methylhydantoinase A
MIDIHVIGAGGGSIAAVDAAGALKVGPRSAGASPGPVAYGQGGTEATITDANLTLGRLDPDTFLGGRMSVDLDAARRVIAETIAGPLGLSVEAAAHGVIQIANANMSRTIRAVSIERGYAISDFALAAFGGAGPLHAAEVAIECGIPKVLIPVEPGTLCARGMLYTDLSSDYVRSAFRDADPGSWRDILALLDGLGREGDAWLDREAVPRERREERRILDARYRGQNFEVKVDCSGLGQDDFDEVVRRFHAAHEREYGYFIADRPIEFVTCRVQAVGSVPKPAAIRHASGPSVAAARIGRRPIYVDARLGWREADIYERSRLPVGEAFMGPALVNEMSATTVILPGQRATVDEAGNMILEVAP